MADLSFDVEKLGFLTFILLLLALDSKRNNIIDQLSILYGTSF